MFCKIADCSRGAEEGCWILLVPVRLFLYHDVFQLRSTTQCQLDALVCAFPRVHSAFLPLLTSPLLLNVKSTPPQDRRNHIKRFITLKKMAGPHPISSIWFPDADPFHNVSEFQCKPPACLPFLSPQETCQRTSAPQNHLWILFSEFYLFQNEKPWLLIRY